MRYSPPNSSWADQVPLARAFPCLIVRPYDGRFWGRPCYIISGGKSFGYAWTLRRRGCLWYVRARSAGRFDELGAAFMDVALHSGAYPRQELFPGRPALVLFENYDEIASARALQFPQAA